MSNAYWSEFDRGLGDSGAKPPSPGTPSGKPPGVTEKTKAWPGLPGTTGPNRSAGVPKLKIHPVSNGI